MASLKGFLTKSIGRSLGQKITAEALKQLFPIRNLSEEILDSFATDNHVEMLAAGTTLFTVSQPADCAIYLLSGRVTLSDQNGKSYEIEAGSAQAKFPLCSGMKHTTTAVAKTDIGVLRVSLNIMASTNHIDHGTLVITDEYHDNRLLALFAEHFR
ncbi:MAG: cyclic nucleotide-binding domain-containing protein, partial [Methylococcaceae bacterium]|nr:cyclic nucleotide-binding domain-containing protein [Methylococcaceae bacterium]